MERRTNRKLYVSLDEVSQNNIVEACSVDIGVEPNKSISYESQSYNLLEHPHLITRCIKAKRKITIPKKIRYKNIEPRLSTEFLEL